MRNFKLTLEYDGTDFFGFQKQKDRRTVQEELEKVFRRVFARPVKISAASGRTDRGVHAEGQVVNVKVATEIPVRNLHRAFNSYLPKDVAVLRVEEVSRGFHARFNVKRKTYRYVVWNAKAPSPLLRRASYHFPHALDIGLMRKASRFLVGKRDFRSFQTKAGGKDSVRTIYRLSIEKEGGKVIFLIEGDGFLYNMARSIVGTLLAVGAGRISVKEFGRIFRKKNRSHKGPTAPSNGLTLFRVTY